MFGHDAAILTDRPMEEAREQQAAAEAEAAEALDAERSNEGRGTILT